MNDAKIKKAVFSWTVLALGIFLSLFTVSMSAQSGAGSIQGTVKDATGAVIDGAAIHVVNTATNVANDTKTNHVGFFQVPGLFTGHYRLTVTSTGMKTYQTSLELLVSQNAVINPAMAAGEISQKVEVNADTVQLTTNDSPAVESTLENARIMDLPQNGRDITQTISLTTPGEVVNGVQQPVLNGGDLGTLTYVIDGMSASNTLRGGAFQPNATLIDPDSVQEVRVETSNSSAQFATPGAAVMSTKSGTNKLHGTFFETARNNAFGVDRQRSDTSPFKAPKYIRNEFGLSAGGPVYIPHVYDGRDKTFWFFAYERYSLSQQTVTPISVPTVAMRNGDYSNFTTAKGVQQHIFDPTTTANNASCAYTGALDAYCRTQFAYQGVKDTIDPARESPLAQVAFALYPLPTSADNPKVSTNVNTPAPALQITPKKTFRIDQHFNEKNSAYIRYTQQGNTVHTTASTPYSRAVGPTTALPNVNIPTGAVLGYKNAPNYSFNAAVGFTHIFSPTFFSETVLGGDWQHLINSTGLSPNVNYEKELNLPNNFGELGFPNLGTKATLLQLLSGSQSGNQQQIQRDFAGDENLTKTLGRHQIHFGGRLAHNLSVNQPNTTTDQAVWNTLPTALMDQATVAKATYGALTNTGSSEAALFLGQATSYQVAVSGPRENYHQWQGSLYVQDDFHVNSRLVVNLGLRYEAHPATQTENGLATSFDLKNDAQVLATPTAQLVAKGYTAQGIIDNLNYLGAKFETPQEAGLPSGSMLNSYNWNFLPRAGFAWTLGNSSRSPVFRGGYGIYLYDSPLEDFATGGDTNVPYQATFVQSYVSPAQTDGANNALLRLTPAQMTAFGDGFAGASTGGVQNAVNTTFSPAAPPLNPSTVTSYAVAANWKPVHVQQYNATLEIPMPARSALRISYIGSKTTDLDINDSYNNPTSAFQYDVSAGVNAPSGNGLVAVTNPTTKAITYTAPLNPYDQKTWGTNSYIEKMGWANYNALQMNYQRLYHNGSAFQISYVWSKAMRAGGDLGGPGTGLVQPLTNFPGHNGSAGRYTLETQQTAVYGGTPPPAAPAGLPTYQTWHDMIRYQLYQQDSNSPAHYIRFNGIYDIPVGRGKHFLSTAPKWLNEIIGGFQLAGNGEVRSQMFQPGTGIWGPISAIKIYKKSKPIRDCSSGVCYNNYLWWNGNITPQQNPLDPNHMLIDPNSPLVPKGPPANAPCETTGVCITGIPADFTPAQVSSHDVPNDVNYQTDKVDVHFAAGGATSAVAYDAGPAAVTNYYAKTWLPGPYNWVANASLFKVFPIYGSMNLRINLDAFNVFNMPGENNPGTNGIEAFRTNYNTARQLQITARLSF